MSVKNPLPRPSLYDWYRRYPPPAGRRHGPVLSLEELVQCRKAVVEVLLRRRRSGEPVTGFPELLARLDDLMILGSADGTASGAGGGQLEAVPKLVDTTEAAAILDCSREWARKLAPRLGGQFVGGSWVLPLEAVLQHAAGKEPE